MMRDWPWLERLFIRSIEAVILLCHIFPASSTASSQCQGDGQDAAPAIKIFTPIRGAVLPAGSMLVNYTVSGCKTNYLLELRFDGDVVGRYKCQKFVHHILSIDELDEPLDHMVEIDLYNEEQVLAHAISFFEVVKTSSGRLFGQQQAAVISDVSVGAFFRWPLNGSIIPWSAQGLQVQLTSQNFVAGHKGLFFRLSVPNNVTLSRKTDNHSAMLLLSPGPQCLYVDVESDEEGVLMGLGDSVCFLLWHASDLADSCSFFQRVLAAKVPRFALVVEEDLSCSVAHSLERLCPSCTSILCSSWVSNSGDMPQMPHTIEEYSKHFSQNVRRLASERVSSLRRESLHILLFVRPSKNKFTQWNVANELEKTWGLVKPGGMIGVLELKQSEGFQIEIENDIRRSNSSVFGLATCNTTFEGSSVVLAGKSANIEVNSSLSSRFVVDHVYVVHFQALRQRRLVMESMLYNTLGLSHDRITFVDSFDRRTINTKTVEQYYQPTSKCFIERLVQVEVEKRSIMFNHTQNPLDTLRHLLHVNTSGKGQVCNSISHFEALRHAVQHNYESFLVLEDDMVVSLDFFDTLPLYMDMVDPDWGVVVTDSAVTCGWWDNCPDLKPRRAAPSVYRRTLPATAQSGGMMWSLSAAKDVVSAFLPFCLVFDIEIEYHWMVHAISVFYISPALSMQGTSLNPWEEGYTTSTLVQERESDKH